MASPNTSSLLFLLIAFFVSSTIAATFTIGNNCNFTVWPAAIPVGSGLRLNPGQTWTLNVPAGTRSGRIWGRTSCSFNGTKGHCKTGDCNGELSCHHSGQPPTTLAEFSIGGGDRDYYDISVINGYNLAMKFSCSTGFALQCTNPRCLITYGPQPRIPSCKGNSNFTVIFCP
ncbi:hypothetical protein PR202_gb24374 [Eleusine coracana subsp. coracana]|uniref:Thaumatin-like protein n=1 Tax=Eleusine coracana subsp. coracana TaxID=191504 RepID=A0AAV5FL20_ELECO|nr:hypothetical protein QOZ80_5BG0447680 [Eleusine coracana subsp. coracana]GJN35583.1 hypothetical protein PR202_gb24374 [Eleusine coracana subsp. coracana]